MRCPICKREVHLADSLMPFCSDRCRLIDLGNWAAEKYVIPAPAATVAEAADGKEGPDDQ